MDFHNSNDKAGALSTRQQRRRWRAMARQRNKELVNFNDDARWFPGGPASMRVAVFRLEYAPALEAAIAANGGRRDAEMEWVAGSVTKFLAECSQYSVGEGFQCLCCDGFFGAGRDLPVAIVLAAPLKSTDTTLAIGVCSRCSSTHDDEALAQAYCAYLRRTIWPGAHLGGRL